MQFSDLSRIRSPPSLEPWRPRDVPRAGRPPPRRVARGSRPGGRPSAARRRAARSAVPAGASPRRVATMPKNMVRQKSARRCAFHRRCVHSGCVEFQTFRRSCQSGSTVLCPACVFFVVCVIAIVLHYCPRPCVVRTGEVHREQVVRVVSRRFIPGCKERIKGPFLSVMHPSMRRRRPSPPRIPN